MNRMVFIALVLIFSLSIFTIGTTSAQSPNTNNSNGTVAAKTTPPQPATTAPNTKTATTAAAPQAPPPPPAPQAPQTPLNNDEDLDLEPIKIGAEIVLLNVLVTDTKNRYVDKLGKEDFEIYEDGVRQDVTFFTRQDEPVSLGILVDSSLSMLENNKMVEARAAVKALLSATNPKDEAFLMRFDDKVALLQDFTDDLKGLGQQTERLKPFGGTAMYDAMVRAMQHTKKNSRRQRQALILITDGLDQHSRNRLKDVLPVAQLTGIPCYAIGIYTPEELQVFAKNEPTVKLNTGQYVDNPALALRSITDETAGRAYFPSSEKELVTIALQIVNELRAGYALGYYPPASSLDGRYHSISVTSKAKKFVVRARRGYISKVE